MSKSRFLSSLFCITLSLTAFVAVLSPAGCKSQVVAYTETASPVGISLTDDFEKYASVDPDMAKRTANLEMSGAFRSFLTTGNAKSASATWFGTGNMRSLLLEYWSGDAKFRSAIGGELLQIKIHNVETLDYVLSVGETQQSR